MKSVLELPIPIPEISMGYVIREIPGIGATLHRIERGISEYSAADGKEYYEEHVADNPRKISVHFSFKYSKHQLNPP